MVNKKKLEVQIENLLGRLKALSPNVTDSDVSLEEVVEEFLRAFPSIAEHEDYHGEAAGYADTAYLFFGVLNSILCANTERNESIELTKSIIVWVNNLYNNSETSESVRNLFAIEFFEQADGSDVYADFLRQLLTDKMAEDFRTHPLSS